MTRAQLREAIKRESRIKSGTNLDALIDDIVADIMRDYCNKARYYETLLTNVPLVMVARQQDYSLPAGFMNLEAVRFGRGPTPTTYRDVIKQPSQVRQTWSGGYPKYYRLIAGPKLSFFPYYDIVVADLMMIDYYTDPALLFAEEADEFPIPRLESAVKKDAISRMQRFHSADTESQITDADAASSFKAADSASH